MLRRNWLTILGVILLIGLFVMLFWLNKRGDTRSAALATATGTARPRATATATVTPDPAVGEVRAAAVRWVQAYYDTYRTDSTAEVDALTVTDSVAYGNDGGPLLEMNQLHKTFLVDRVDCPMIAVTADTPVAKADISCTLSGSEATWPGLQRGKPMTDTLHWVLGFQEESLKWLVYAVS